MQGVFLVKTYGNILSSTSFRTEYPINDTPNHCLIKNILSNFVKNGSVHMRLQNINI